MLPFDKLGSARRAATDRRDRGQRVGAARREADRGARHLRGEDEGRIELRGSAACQLLEAHARSLFTVAVSALTIGSFRGHQPRARTAHGPSRLAHPRQGPHECLTSEVADAVTARYRECVRRGEAISYSERLDLPGGVRLWRTNLAPVRDPTTGQVVLLFGSARDVTSDLEASAELARLNERLQSILSSVSDCYCTFDREFRITAINPAAVQWLGLAEDSAVGTSLKEEFSGDHECMRGTRAA